jgi:hypothetical protein
VEAPEPLGIVRFHRLELVTALRVSYREQQRAPAETEALCCSREDVERPGLDILDLGKLADDLALGSVDDAKRPFLNDLPPDRSLQTDARAKPARPDGRRRLVDALRSSSSRRLVWDSSILPATAIKYATSVIRLISIEELSLGTSCSFAVADDGAD